MFSNQLPSNSIQSLEVISGAPPAEYGGKTSLVIVATTRSGQGLTKPTGDIATSYGTFGSATGGFDLGYGGKNWGNFVEFDGLNTGRFLDPPEFVVFHDKGNEENAFDRVDYQFTPVDSVHLNLNYSRSWFQTPNAYDNVNVSERGQRRRQPRPRLRQRRQHRPEVQDRNLRYRADVYPHLRNERGTSTLGPTSAGTRTTTIPAAIPLADLGPPNLQTSSIAQYRTLTNAGLRTDFSYEKGINNIKVGAVYQQTFLRENDSLGVVEPTYNSPMRRTPTATRMPGFSDPTQCAARLVRMIRRNPAALTIRFSRPTT